jgi:hypothetical protein
VATLGIVEFLLYLIGEYHKDYDKSKKGVFADVHFLLFYTAIINAILSAVLFCITSQYSYRIWVKTEMLELNHYVEIREEFQIVKDQLESKRLQQDRHLERKVNRSSAISTSSSESSFPKAKIDKLRNRPIQNNNEVAEDVVRLKYIVEWIREKYKYPELKQRYNDLLLQIRFHELRIHFLQAYKLLLLRGYC